MTVESRLLRESEVPKGASHVEAASLLPAFQEARDRLDVVGPHLQLTALGSNLLNGDGGPSFRAVHHVRLELVFFVPL